MVTRPTDNHAVIGIDVGTRLKRIVRLHDGWIVWTATSDYIHGSYLVLADSGAVFRVTVRAGEGDEIHLVRPSDAEIAGLC